MNPRRNTKSRPSCAAGAAYVQDPTRTTNWLGWLVLAALAACWLATRPAAATEPSLSPEPTSRVDILLDPATLPERDRAASAERLEAIAAALDSDLPLFRSFDPRDTLQDTLRILASHGADVGETAVVNFDTLEVTIPVTAKSELAKLPFIKKIRKPVAPVSTGVFDSEGVGLTGADLAQAATPAVDGTGISVAIIDRDYRHLGATMADPNDELKTIPVDPNQWEQRSSGNADTWDHVSLDFKGDREHGTAMAEVIYEMAPGANIVLYRIKSIVGIENAIAHAANQGYDIIVVPLTHIETMGDPQNRFTDDIDEAVAMGSVVIVAGGNEAQRHVQDTYRACTDCFDFDSGGLCETASNDANYHEFDDGFEEGPLNAILFLEDDYYDAGVFNITCWSAIEDGWDGSDFEVRLHRWDDGDFDNFEPTCPGDAGLQNVPEAKANLGESFTRSIVVEAPEDEYLYYLSLRHKSHSSNDPLDPGPSFRIACGSGFDEFLYVTTPGSLSDLAVVENAITVAEVDGFLGKETSLTNSIGPALSGPIKPDISGPGDVSNFASNDYGFSGFGTFTGTSAASAHVAGVVALVQHYRIQNGLPMLSAADMKSWLQSTAIDVLIGDGTDVGLDVGSGAGLVQVPPSVYRGPLLVELNGVCGGSSTCYAAAQDAATDVAAGETIQMATDFFDENVMFDLPATTTIGLSGGWDAAFTIPPGTPKVTISSSAVLGATTVRSMTISGGVVQIP